jgi:hypothetical protein
MWKNKNGKSNKDFSGKQTFEFRVPDGSADIYTLAAGLIMASLHGLDLKDALKKADKLYVPVNIFKDEYNSITKSRFLNDSGRKLFEIYERSGKKRDFISTRFLLSVTPTTDQHQLLLNICGRYVVQFQLCHHKFTIDSRCHPIEGYQGVLF